MCKGDPHVEGGVCTCLRDSELLEERGEGAEDPASRGQDERKFEGSVSCEGQLASHNSVPSFAVPPERMEATTSESGPRASGTMPSSTEAFEKKSTTRSPTGGRVSHSYSPQRTLEAEWGKTAPLSRD